ncbi:Hypothetical predicted protein [Paramuricea clavata]|uniref:Uncharacterized protein n=1 Tax=Paramuricea clavata TaxID=317549 RepID=A0A6S7GRN1_PARCT|nr:Hypothetical predicted protein [Paramuricea clavata]
MAGRQRRVSIRSVNVTVEMAKDKAYKQLYSELVSWIRKATAKAEVTGALSHEEGAFEIHCEGRVIFSKLARHGFPVLNEVAQVVRCISESKPWEEITKINRAKCRCGHEDCMCGISIMVTKATCPCECDGECPGA